MTEFVSSELFDELAKTGKLGIDGNEAEILRAALNDRLTVIHQLESIPLNETIRPVIHGNPYPSGIRCDLREDQCRPFAFPNDIIEQAPSFRDGYIVSPDVEHQRLN